MSKEKIKLELTKENMGVNPFIDGLTIFVTKSTHKVLNKFDSKDVKERDLESTPYTKVFEVNGDRKQMAELPIRSKELYLWMIHTIKSSQDLVWIDKKAYMKLMGISSVNTYKVAVNGLSDGLYIYPHYKIKDVFWINPHFFFKGSRINKYPKNIVVKNILNEK